MTPTIIDIDYFLSIAHAARKNKCLKRSVGAVVVLDNRIVATGYNGMPSGVLNCSEGGCMRCADPEGYPSGQGYLECLCVHAEMNCFLMAARFGVALAGSWLYCTLEPCLDCLKSSRQVGVIGIVFSERNLIPKNKVNDTLETYFKFGIQHHPTLP